MKFSIWNLLLLGLNCQRLFVAATVERLTPLTESKLYKVTTRYPLTSKPDQISNPVTVLQVGFLSLGVCMLSIPLIAMCAFFRKDSKPDEGTAKGAEEGSNNKPTQYRILIKCGGQEPNKQESAPALVVNKSRESVTSLLPSEISELRSAFKTRKKTVEKSNLSNQPSLTKVKTQKSDDHSCGLSKPKTIEAEPRKSAASTGINIGRKNKKQVLSKQRNPKQQSMQSKIETKESDLLGPSVISKASAI